VKPSRHGRRVVKADAYGSPSLALKVWRTVQKYGASFDLDREGGEWIRCLVCGLTSHNRNDVLYKYCDNCKLWHQAVPGPGYEVTT